MPNNGVILVVTMAGSHQLELEKTIKEKSLKKNIKIYFAFSRSCRYTCEDSLPVYKRLSRRRMFTAPDFSRKSFYNIFILNVIHGLYMLSIDKLMLTHVDWFPDSDLLDKSSNFSLLTTSIYHMKYLRSVSRENNLRYCTLAQLGKDGVNGPIAHTHVAKGPK